MRRDSLLICGLVLLTFACFWPVGSLGFIGYDDYDYVYQNPVVRAGLDFDSLVWAFHGAHAGNWHPITWLSHMLDCELFGLDPHEEHWVNLGFHAANTALLFWWLRGLTGARWRSFLVAALFAVHPLHVQSVAWISERKDVLSGFFFMLTLLAYTRYAEKPGTVGGGGEAEAGGQDTRGRQSSFFQLPASSSYRLALLFFALGLMAKPMLVTVPCVLLLLDFWPLGRFTTQAAPGHRAGGARRFAIGHSSWLPLLVEKIPFLLLSLASCLVTLWAQNTSGAMHSMQATSLGGRCLHALVAYSLYLAKMFWPVNLSIYYPLSLANPRALAVLGSLLLLSVLCLAAFRWRRDQPWLLTGWTWFLVMLLPVIGVVQVGLQSMADRYVYLPSIGLFLAVVWGVASLLADPWPQWKSFNVRRSRFLLRGCFAGIVLLCALDSRYQLRFWRNNITLFQHSVAVSPINNFLGNFYLGISYGELGELDSAARCLTAALAINPDFETAQGRLGNVLLLQKKYAAAQPLLEPLAKAHPNDFPCRVALGMALAGQRKFLAAQSEYQAAQQLNPNSPTVNHLLTANAPKAGAEQELSALASRLETNSEPQLHARAALAQSVLGRYTEAIQQYKLALAQTPDAADCLNNLAWLLATCPQAAVRNASQAVSLARHACAVTQYQQTVYLGTLAAAYAEAGQFDDAVVSAKRACDRARAQGASELLAANQRLLTLYQNHQPYHEPVETSP